MSFRINHLHLKTPDPKKTAEFYVEYTDAKIVKENIRPMAVKTTALIYTAWSSTSQSFSRSRN